MKIYLVGGAVRDELLGLPVTERDWVVVGATPEEMLAQGFIAVGQDFPVFLHPETKEEYALARTERKIAKGYKGFQFYAAPDVRLVDDLKRRDLTINAMARATDGELIDPYGGQEDLQRKYLRHVSPAFAEDPVRILRVARFAAKLPEFIVFKETQKFMQKMVNNGEVDALVPERVWKELSRALIENNPLKFFLVLYDCGALNKLLPEIKLENSGYIALQHAITISKDPCVRFSSLLYDLPIQKIKNLCQKLRAPKDYQDLSVLTAKNHESFFALDEKNADAILQLLKNTDALRRPQRFKQFMVAMRAISLDKHLQREKLLTDILTALIQLDTQDLQQQNLAGIEFAHALAKKQKQLITKMI